MAYPSFPGIGSPGRSAGVLSRSELTPTRRSRECTMSASTTNSSMIPTTPMRNVQQVVALLGPCAPAQTAGRLPNPS